MDNKKQWDDFYDAFNGKDNICGTNVRWIEKKITELIAKPTLTCEEKEQLNKYYSELGRTSNGSKKPKTCWSFVDHGGCSHSKVCENDVGFIARNLWHPGNEERIYLKKKR